MELWNTFLQLISVLLKLIVELGSVLLAASLLIAYVAWWLWAVNWKKAWLILGQGGWAPVVLLVFLGGLVWAKISPGEFTGLRIVTVPNFWWQFGGAALLAGVALFCGWLQGVMGWEPPAVNFDPPAHAPDHGHGHDVPPPHDDHQHGHELGLGHEDPPLASTHDH